MRSGAGSYAFVRNLDFYIILGRATFGEIWILIWGATLGRNFDVNIERAA
jgi:hypothetical protein